MTAVTPKVAEEPILDEVRRFYEENHEGIERARGARRYFYGYSTRVLQSRIPPGQRVLDIGCGSGHLLAALEPSLGVGIDLSAPAVAAARERYGSAALRFLAGNAADPAVLGQAGGPFDVILMVNVVSAPRRRPGHVREPAARLPPPHAHLRLQLQPPVAARAPPGGSPGPEYRQPPEAWLPPKRSAP